MKKYFSREVKIGIAVIVSAVALYFCIEFLKGVNIMHPTNYYYIHYNNVTGLSVSTPVTIDGFKVGLVRDIQYDYASGQGAVVEISLDKQLNVPEGSSVVMTSDLLGTVTLNVQLNKSATAMHSPGDYLIGVIDTGLMGAVQGELLPSLTALLPKIDSVLTGLNDIVHSTELKSTLNNVEKISDDLQQASAQLTTLLANDIPGIVADVKQITGNVNRFTAELNKVDIEQTMRHIDETVVTVNTLAARLQTPDNTIGALLTDTRLYDSLNATVMSADSLLIDLRVNPKRYVHFSLFGSKKQ